MGQGGVAGSAASLEDRYFLQKVKLGEGSFGTVWRAVDRRTNEVVAIKQLDKASLPRRGVRRSDIEREVAMMKACAHENITKLFDTFEDEARIYLALEYCDGGDFGDKVKERGLGLQEQECAEWMRQICSAIGALHHKGICHRDIKPDNFMVSGHSSGSQLKLSDFGLAVYLPRGKVLQEKCGTPAFMAPEQHELPKRSSGYGFPADVWAAGVSMYMVMFGGRHPFLGDRGQLDDKLLMQGALDFREGGQNRFFGWDIGPASLRFSDAARDLCSRMVCPDPAQRYRAEDCLHVPWLCMGRAMDQARAPAPPGGFGRGTAMEQQPSPMVSAPQRVQRPVTAQQPGPPAPPPVPPMAPHVHANGFPTGKEDVAAQAPVPFPMPKEQGGWGRDPRDYQRSRTKKFSDAPEDQRRKGAGLGTLPAGTKCRYDSDKYGWVESVVIRFNENGTYDLEHKHGAPLDKIAPSKVCSVAEQAWPVGSLAMYHSSSVNRWLPAVVKAFDEATKMYDLDVRDHADSDRIRAGRWSTSGVGPPPVDEHAGWAAHVPAPAAVGAGGGAAGGGGYPGEAPAPRERDGGKELRDGSEQAPLKLHDLKPAAEHHRNGRAQPERHGEGMVCNTSEHGLVRIEQFNPLDSTVTALVLGTRPEQRVRVQERHLRAPSELPHAWAGNTKVWYDSATSGGRIPAMVQCFNDGLYNLDVRPNAAPERVTLRFRGDAD